MEASYCKDDGAGPNESVATRLLHFRSLPPGGCRDLPCNDQALSCGTRRFMCNM